MPLEEDADSHDDDECGTLTDYGIYARASGLFHRIQTREKEKKEKRRSDNCNDDNRRTPYILVEQQFADMDFQSTPLCLHFNIEIR